MKSSNQPVSIRKKTPTLSVEEELAELMSDPTLQPSIGFLGLRSGRVSVSDTETVSDTDTRKPIIYRDRAEANVSVSDTESVSDTVSVPVPSKTKTHDPALYHRPNAVAARQVQDGHSHSEHAVYTALWDAAQPHSPDARTVTMGFGAMSKLARLSLNNCRLNIRSLVRKLAIEEIGSEDCENKVGKTYLVYSGATIMKRRKAAGLEWVVRTKGVSFIDPKTGARLLPKVGVSVSGTETVSDTVSVSVTGTETVPVRRAPLEETPWKGQGNWTA
jgi:hypothetical protein